MNRLSSSVVFGAVVMLGCTGQVGETSTASSASSRDSLVLFHATTGIFRIEKSKLTPEDFRQRVENFYPAVCVDTDVDHDSLPDELDDDSDDREGDDHRDGGVGDDRRDGGDDHSSCGHSGGDGRHDDDGEHRDGGDDDERENRLHRCQVCNRGPGTQGDFRLEVRGTEGRLERGRVFTRTGNTIQVVAPGGTVTITIRAGARVRGEPTPGSEIRARGVMQAGASRTINADELEVLCPGPAPINPDQVPPGADPLPPVIN